MPRKEQTSPRVNIGNVQGGITNSMIAGGDIRNATINVGGRDLVVDSTPRPGEFKQLLEEIRTALENVSMNPDPLQAISPASPYMVEGAKASLAAAAENVEDAGQDTTKANLIQKSVGEATNIMGTLLDSAKTVADKATSTGKSAKSLIETLGPLVEKLAVAGLWAARIWSLH